MSSDFQVPQHAPKAQVFPPDLHLHLYWNANVHANAVPQVVAARRQDAEGRVGSGIGADDRAVQFTVQHILAADAAAGVPPRTVTIPVSNAQVSNGVPQSAV